MASIAPITAGAFAVDEVNDLKELAGYRMLWNALLPQTRRATFFQSYDWLVSYWRHFGEGQRLRVLVVSSGDEPLGILPLVVRREKTRIGAIRVLTYPLHDWGSFYGPVGPNATATLLGAMRYLRGTPRDWDALDLRWVDVDHCDHGRTGHAMRLAGFRAHKQVWSQSCLVEMQGTWQEYYAGRPAKWRQNVERGVRRLSDEGELVHLRHRPEPAACGDGDPRWDLYDQCEDLAARSWQGSSSTGTTLSHDSIRPFLRDVHAAAARTGSLDLNLLLLDGRPIAFHYNYVYRGSVCGLRMGYDPEVRRFGPGTVLQRLMLEDSFRRGDRVLDLGPGSTEVKRHWMTSAAASYRYAHYSPASLRSQLLRLKRWMDQRRADAG